MFSKIISIESTSTGQARREFEHRGVDFEIITAEGHMGGLVDSWFWVRS